MEVTIQFKSKKDYNRFLRNYNSNKGFVISPKNCDILHDGSGFLDVAKSFGKDIAKKTLKEGVKAGVKAIKGANSLPGPLGQIGNQIVDVGADFATGAINKKVDGLGIGMVGNTLSSIPPQARAAWLRNHQGAGFLDQAKKMAKKAAKSKIGKDLMKAGINAASNQAANYIPQSGMAGVIGNTLNNAVKQEATKQVEGMGISSGIPYNSLGGNGLAQNINNINDRMAHARSFKRGGSFRLP